jgi:hypothetical protein
MNSSKHRSRCLTRLGILIVICAAAGLSGCSSTVKLNYVNWEVEFTSGTSELDRAIAMDSISRYILNQLSGEKYTGLVLNRIDLKTPNLSDRDRAAIAVSVRFGETGQQATRPPPPKGGPGNPSIFPHPPAIPSNISHVSKIVEVAH